MTDFDPSNLIVPGIVFAALLLLYFGSMAWRTKMKAKHGRVVDLAFNHLHKPVEILLAVTALYVVIDNLQLRWSENPLFYQLYLIAVIMLLGWLGMRIAALLSIVAAVKLDANKKDDARTRTVQAQLRILRRVAFALIGLLAASAILTGYGDFRVLGYGLLGAAGIVLFIVGLAAKKTVGVFFAGLQVSMAQPVRVGDTVTIDGVSGTVEAINMTHVVVKTGDGGNMIVPVGLFTKKTFRTGGI